MSNRRKKIEESLKNKDKIRGENWDKNMESLGSAWDSLLKKVKGEEKKKKDVDLGLDKKKVRKFKEGFKK
jgi:hypothetical protein